MEQVMVPVDSLGKNEDIDGQVSCHHRLRS